jgi:hypothetical protein
MRHGSITFLVMAFGLIGTANADIKQGMGELAIFGNLNHANFGHGDSEDMGALAVGLGYFHTREIEFGLQGMGNWSRNLDLYSFGGNVKYHFTPDLTTVPYAGAHLNYGWYNSYTRKEEGLMYGPLAGIRYFVSRSVSIFVEYQYQIYDGNIGDVVEDAHCLFLGILFKTQ